MQGSIAQVVALTAHGNSILQHGWDSRGVDFYPLNSTFKFCESVTFVDVVSRFFKKQEQTYAIDPGDWYKQLGREGVYRIRMSYGLSGQTISPDRMLVGFVGGGGKWLIETDRPDRTDSWEPRWQLGNRESADKKIWRVVYARILNTKPSSAHQLEDLERLKIELKSALEDISQLSRSQNLDWFTKAFESGLARLESQMPLEGTYHSDLAPAGSLPLSADQLLGSAQAAWVFGGMGSWNDQGFDGPTQAHYEEVSERLYQLLNRVIVAATNSGVSR